MENETEIKAKNKEAVMLHPKFGCLCTGKACNKLRACLSYSGE